MGREEPLPGGSVTSVVRIGQTVRRGRRPGSAYVHAVLAHLAAAGWAGAPRFLGIDEQGREVLSFLDGHVAWQPRQPPEVTGDGSLTRAARLLREFHDLTAGTALAGDREVVCHNDVSPRNTVYRDLGAGLRPVAFLDWDLAAPGDRVQDLAHLCWQYLDLGPVVGDAVRAGRRMRAVCDAYGLPDRRTLLDTVLWWQDRCARGIAAQAAAGDPAMVRLRERGVVAGVRAAHDWVERHRGELAAGLDDGDATPGRR